MMVDSGLSGGFNRDFFFKNGLLQWLNIGEFHGMIMGYSLW